MNDLTQGHEGKQILLFTLPMLIGSLFQQLYNTADAIIVGRFIGTEAMAAVSVANPIMLMLTSFLTGTALGFSILVSKYYGAQETKKVVATIHTTYIFVFVASLIITLLGVIFGSALLHIINTPLEVFDQAKDYLVIIFIGTLFSAGYNAISAILRGLGDSRNPLYFLIIATVLNIVLDVVFVIQFKMGVGGVALATVLAQGVSFVFSLLYLNYKHTLFRLDLRHFSFDSDIFKQGLKIGIPSAIQQMLFSLGNISLQSLVNGFGTSAIAAFGAGMKIESFISLPVINLGAAISTFVAQNIGAKKLERVKKGIHYTNLIAISIALAVVIVFALWSETLISFFNSDVEVIAIGARYLRILGPFFIIATINYIWTSAIKGSGEAIFPLINSVISLWLARIPCSYIFSHFLDVDGIWFGIPAGWCLGFLITFFYYKKGNWLKRSDANS